jgi:TetR/AcrR family transcriptional regulator
VSELKPVFSIPDARDLILEAALAAFAEHGFHGANMRDIAGRAGVSQGLVHHHFGSKEALWTFVGSHQRCTEGPLSGRQLHP